MRSVGVVLPEEVIARMGVSDGDTVYLTEAPGGYELTPYDPEREEQLSKARRIVKRRRPVLRDLAK
jgi:putative addiction module antidote